TKTETPRKAAQAPPCRSLAPQPSLSSKRESIAMNIREIRSGGHVFLEKPFDIPPKPGDLLVQGPNSEWVIQEVIDDTHVVVKPALPNLHPWELTPIYITHKRAVYSFKGASINRCDKYQGYYRDYLVGVKDPIPNVKEGDWIIQKGNLFLVKSYKSGYYRLETYTVGVAPMADDFYHIEGNVFQLTVVGAARLMDRLLVVVTKPPIYPSKYK